MNEKIKEFLEKSISKKYSNNPRTFREFKVILYEENTEFQAAIEMLVEVNKWFAVIPE